MVKLKGGRRQSLECCRCLDGGERADHGDVGDGGHVDDIIDEMAKLKGGRR